MLARALAAEYGTRLVDVMGYEDRSSLVKRLVDLKANDFLFVDECHRLRALDQELLCEAIDNLSLPITDSVRGADENAEGQRTALQPWTLILATDQPGMIVNALNKRAVVQVHLAYYQTRELKEIVEAMATELNILISPQAARHIAEVAGGLPRRAKQYLANLRYYYPDAESRQLSLSDVRTFLEATGVDQNGLTSLEKKYLEIVDDLDGASLDSIALSLGVDNEFVRRQIEPTIVRRRLVRITSAGRQITPAGQNMLHDSNAPSAPVVTKQEVTI
jgi:Holliday junction DNA helicase RuvB